MSPDRRVALRIPEQCPHCGAVTTVKLETVKGEAVLLMWLISALLRLSRRQAFSAGLLSERRADQNPEPHKTPEHMRSICRPLRVAGTLDAYPECLHFGRVRHTLWLSDYLPS